MIRPPIPHTFVRPALLQAVVCVVSFFVAVVAVVGGLHIESTALVEFGALSGVAAASAGLLFTRYARTSSGIFTDYRQFELWDARLRTVCYIGLGVYALVNGVLDVVLKRWENDPVSYSGLASAILAVVVVSLVLEMKYRVLQAIPSRSLLISLSDDTFYLIFGLIMLIALGAHSFAPHWWLDTSIDGIVVLLVGARMNGNYNDDLVS